VSTVNARDGIVKKFESKGKKYRPKQRAQHWIAPEQGLCKINTDAAVDRSKSKGAIAAVCRENQGEFIAATAMVIPHIIEPEALEAMACLEALDLADDCALRKLKVASDCLSVVKNIKDMPRCAYMMVLQDIHERAKPFECVRFAHEGRDSNREAHSLAKYACSMGAGRHVWLGTPPVSRLLSRQRPPFLLRHPCTLAYSSAAAAVPSGASCFDPASCSPACSSRGRRLEADGGQRLRADLHKHNYSVVHDRRTVSIEIPHLNGWICILLCCLSELNTGVETE
jgi:ribonuclease HI